ncbi:MAG: PspC protein [Sphingobacteriales bacterium]|nr:PspC protein [Sphingobacteriales bacterium]
MNKTIIININGIVFHIEEDAYDLLRDYMTGVKRHFAYTPDSEEITTDIENRLAEMFTERLAADNSQVITMLYVQEITAQMGSVNEFELEEETDFNPPLNLKSEKKLFRDMDDRIIGGVCAGIGHYFDIEPRWIRLIAIASVIIGGAGLPLYIVLWIIMPKAVTRADKMAMKGEPINLQSFKKNFDEEVENLKHGFNRAQREVRPAIDRLAIVIGNILKVAVKIVGGFIIFIGGMISLGFIVALIALLAISSNSAINEFPINVANPEYRAGIVVSAFVIIFIPLIALVLFAIRVIFNKRVLTKTSSFAMLIIWLTGIGFGIHFGSRLASEFKGKATFSKTTELKPASVYFLKLNEVKYLSKEDSVQFNIDPGQFKGTVIIDGDENHFDTDHNRIKLHFEQSDIAIPMLTQEYSSRGRDFQSALNNAKRIIYNFKQTDSTLYFDKNLSIKNTELFRDQEINLTLKLPANTKLVIDNRLNRLLYDFDLARCLPEGAPYFETPSRWIMTTDGMKCEIDSLNKRNDARDQEQYHEDHQ